VLGLAAGRDVAERASTVIEVVVVDAVIFILRHSEHRILGLLPWFMLAVVLGGLLQHLRMDVLTKGSLRRQSATAALSTTVFGALTPFCACSIVPLIRSFLMAGVPVSVVMAFWIASPAMAPEIFGMTASAFGVKIALARLIGAVVLAMAASTVARFMESRGMLTEVVRMPRKKTKQTVAAGVAGVRAINVAQATTPITVAGMGMTSIPLVESVGGGTALLTRPAPATVIQTPAAGGCCGPAQPEQAASCCNPEGLVDVSQAADPDAGVPWWRLAKASLKQVTLWDFVHDLVRDTWLVGRWMLVAVVLEACIVRFVPPTAFTGMLGGNLLVSVLIGALLSIPLYLNGISAIPIGLSLVAMGMSPAGITTFMLAGAITTIPAMAGVKAVVHHRIFNLYVATGVLGSIAVGLLSAPFLG
jgi:hypothetical protein